MCLTADENFEEALNEARQKDIELKKAKQNGKLEDLPILHGIPFSVKEQIDLKDTRSTLGTASYVDRDVNEDAHAVKILR